MDSSSWSRTSPPAWESRWSARSAARTNDLDADERRQTMTAGGGIEPCSRNASPRLHSASRATHGCPRTSRRGRHTLIVQGQSAPAGLGCEPRHGLHHCHAHQFGIRSLGRDPNYRPPRIQARVVFPRRRRARTVQSRECRDRRPSILQGRSRLRRRSPRMLSPRPRRTLGIARL
jgi:hypothetical protein